MTGRRGPEGQGPTGLSRRDFLGIAALIACGLFVPDRFRSRAGPETPKQPIPVLSSDLRLLTFPDTGESIRLKSGEVEPAGSWIFVDKPLIEKYLLPLFPDKITCPVNVGRDAQLNFFTSGTGTIARITWVPKEGSPRVLFQPSLGYPPTILHNPVGTNPCLVTILCPDDSTIQMIIPHPASVTDRPIQTRYGDWLARTFGTFPPGPSCNILKVRGNGSLVDMLSEGFITVDCDFLRVVAPFPDQVSRSGVPPQKVLPVAAVGKE